LQVTKFFAVVIITDFVCLAECGVCLSKWVDSILSRLFLVVFNMLLSLLIFLHRFFFT